jgi:hypothetical protein
MPDLSVACLVQGGRPVRWVLLDAWRRVNGQCYKDACQASGSAASVIHPFYLSPIRLCYKSAFPLSQSFSHLSLFPSTYFDYLDAPLYFDSKLFASGIYLHLLLNQDHQHY